MKTRNMSPLNTQTNSARRCQLECEIKNAEQGNDSINDFYAQKTELWD